MHADNYAHKFQTPGGRLIFVPTPAGYRFGEDLHVALGKKWSPPRHFYHLKNGGHVAAAKLHLQNTLFVRLDLSKFYHSVSRAKIHRALRRLKYPQSVAREIARQSTVNQDPLRKDYFSLPFGFVQSPMIASIVLHHSFLGRTLALLPSLGLAVSVYMDDFILSGTDELVLESARRQLEEAASVSNFQFNPAKSVGPASEIVAFNLDISHSYLQVSDTRMTEFAAAVTSGSRAEVDGILGYVGTVNPKQRTALESLVPSSV